MPEVIAIGFGLSGYEFKDKDGGAGGSAAGGGGSSGGGGGGGSSSVDDALGGGIVWDEAELEDGKWVKNNSLKQGVMNICVFQSVPLQITDGSTEYICAIDEQHEINNGKLAYGGGICTKLSSNSSQLTEKLEELETFNSNYESNRSDFVCGVSIHPSYVKEYMNHFYDLELTNEKHIYPLLKQHLLNAEILFNVGGGQAKAKRFKVVHSEESGETNIVKIMSAVLMTNSFKDIITFNSETYGMVGSEKLKFPFASNDYNYKKAMINDFSPKSIKNFEGTKFEKSPINLSELIKWKTDAFNAARPIIRMRFFADESDRGAVQQIIVNCPDEFFKTNYGENASTTIQLGGLSSDDPLVQKYLNKPIKITVPEGGYRLKTLPSNKQVQSGSSAYGPPGKGGINGKGFVSVKVPPNYPLKVYGKTPIKVISNVNWYMADRLEALLIDVANHYEDDLEKVAPAITIWDGMYNNRSIRGGSSPSMHSFGCAFDMDAARNPFRKPAINGRLQAEPIYKPFLEIAKAHGFRQLQNDGMHFQATI